MRKDPTEFRERFAAYKNGKSVNEIYDAGRPLPMYAGGKASKKGAYVQGSEAVSNKRYTSSNAIRNRISKWEGAAMTQDTIDPLTGKIAKKNRPFDEVDRAFYNAIPEDIRDFVLSNQDLADGLYSYAYNVGPNRFAERVVPALRDFRSGVGSVGNVLTSMWAHGDKKLRGLANRRAIERGIVEKALSDQNPTMSRVPYANDDYNYYRANQLGYKPDNTGHLPSRDEVTGTYLKSDTHPTVMHAIVGDLAEGYQPYFDKKTGRLASQTIFKIPTIKEAVESQLFQGLPGYGGGKASFGLFPINVPAAIKGFYNAVKKRAYRTITPQDYNIPKATRQFISGKNRDKQKISPIRNEEWARYLGVPYEGESGFEPSPYRPQKGKTYNTVLRFKDESEILSDQVLNQMLEHQRKTGKNSQLVEGNGGGLGSYTLSLGEDKQGKYISYYDDWDINPFKGISAKLNIPILSNIEDVVPGSNPYTVYGRRYYQKR